MTIRERAKSSTSMTQRGVTLLEVVLALGIIAMSSALAFKTQQQFAEDQRATIMARQINELHDASERFVYEHFGALRQEIIDGGGAPINILDYPADPTLDMVQQGFVEPAFGSDSPYRHDYKVMVSLKGADGLQAVVFAEPNGIVLESDQLGRIAALVGADGGIIDNRATTEIKGVYGGYAVSVTDALAPPANPGDYNGAVVSYNSFDENNVASNFLHRYPVPGVPEANRMHVDIDMNEYSIDNAKSINIVNDGLNSDGNPDNSVLTVVKDDGGTPTTTFVLNNDGSIVHDNDPADGIVDYELTTEGDFHGRTIDLRDEARICQYNTTGCGLNFNQMNLAFVFPTTATMPSDIPNPDSAWDADPNHGLQIQNQSNNFYNFVFKKHNNNETAVRISSNGNFYADQNVIAGEKLIGMKGIDICLNRTPTPTGSTPSWTPTMSDCGLAVGVDTAGNPKAHLVDRTGDGWTHLGGTNNGLAVDKDLAVRGAIRIESVGTMWTDTDVSRVSIDAYGGARLCGSVSELPNPNCGLRIGDNGGIYNRASANIPWSFGITGRTPVVGTGPYRGLEYRKPSSAHMFRIAGPGLGLAVDGHAFIGGIAGMEHAYIRDFAYIGNELSGRDITARNNLYVGNNSVFSNPNGVHSFEGEAHVKAGLHVYNTNGSQACAGRAVALCVQGDAKVSNDIYGRAFYYESDERLKENIKPIENALERVSQIRGVDYHWRDDGRKDVGLIAQEVEQVFPELVATDENGMKAVDYAHMVGPLVEAIKDLDGQNRALRDELESLKGSAQDDEADPNR